MDDPVTGAPPEFHGHQVWVRRPDCILEDGRLIWDSESLRFGTLPTAPRAPGSGRWPTTQCSPVWGPHG